MILSAESIGATLNVIFSLAPQIAAVRHSNHYTGRKQHHLYPYHLSVLFDSRGELYAQHQAAAVLVYFYRTLHPKK